MKKSSDSPSLHLSISPCLVRVFCIFYACGFLIGMVYSFIQASYLQFAMDLVLMLVIVAIALRTYRTGINYQLILIAAAYGALLIFFTDSLIAISQIEDNTAIRILGNGMVIVAISAFISLFSSRLIALIAGLSAGLVFLLFSCLQSNQYYQLYNIYIQPAFFGISIFLFTYRHLRDSWLSKLGQQQSNKRPVVNLAEYRITAAEYRCIGYLMQSMINKEMALIEGCSESAIQSRLGLIYRKLAVRDRQALMLFLGSVEPKWEPENNNSSDKISA